MKQRNRSLFFAAVLLAAALPAKGQVIFGSVQGTVTDETGAVVPNVRVRLKNVDTGVVRSGVSNSAGLYVIGEVRPGAYELEAEATGFSRNVQSGIAVRIEDRLRVDIKLRVGQVTERVEVTAEVPLIQTEQTTLGKVVEEKAIKQLPLSGRSAFSLVTLVPGVQQRSGDEQPRLSGGRARTGEFVVDGSTITEARRGEVQTQPNLDAVQEFKVQTNGLSAEFGRTAGGVVNATLKSGTNRYHGNLFEFLRNDNLNARNFFANTVPKQARNQFGGMIGGPIRKDRTFFFAAYEGLLQRGESNFNLTIPTPAMRGGDYRGLAQIFDPDTTRLVSGRFVRDPFPGNAIPTARFDVAGKRVLDLFPEPNLPGIAQNFRILRPSGSTNKKGDIRVDHRFGDSDLVFFRFSMDRQNGLVARPFPASITGGQRETFNRYKSGALNWTRTVTAAVVNDVRFSFFRGQEERIFEENVTPSALGIPNLGEKGLPRIDIPGFGGIGDVVIRSPSQEQYQLQDIATFVRGRHILKAGGDFRRFVVNDLQLENNGRYGLSTLQTGEAGNARTGHVIASLLLGQIDSFTNDPNRGRFYHRSHYLGVFFQDDFKLTPALTLNMGFRYDIEQQPNEIRWNGSNFDLARGRVVTMRELGRNRIQLTDRNNFAPRFGFAWRPFGQSGTVVRSHYGILYTPLTGRATSAFNRFPQSQIFTLRSDAVNAAVILSRTLPVVPNEEGKGLSHAYRDERAPAGYFQQWNFDIQQQVPFNVLLQASYSANVGKKIPRGVNYNQIRIEAVQAAGRGTQAMRPYADFGEIGGQDERGGSNYQSLQLSAERRFSGGFYFLTAYTFSKLIDDVEDVFGAAGAIDSYNLGLEKGLSWAHFPHRFVGSAVYDLPFGKSKPFAREGWLSRIAGGWQLGTILELQSGNQVTISQATNTSNTFNAGFRPNRIASGVLPGSQRTLLRWFNTDAFQAPLPRAFGDSPTFPDIQGPGQAAVDLSLVRYLQLPLNEVSRLEIRGECFNCLNRTNFNEPNGTFGTPNFGRVTSAGAARFFQLALKFWF